MKDIKLFDIICGFTLGSLLIVLGCLIYIRFNAGGYYCAHCKKPGIYYIPVKAEQVIGSTPCSKSSSGKHTIEFFWKDPREKSKYIE